jgi:hypothetical protein
MTRLTVGVLLLVYPYYTPRIAYVKDQLVFLKTREA